MSPITVPNSIKCKILSIMGHDISLPKKNNIVEGRSVLGKRIRDLRINQHWTQSQLARKLGVHPKSIKNWESDMSDPSIENLINICNIFHISADEILGRDTTNFINIGVLDDENKRKLMAVIQAYLEACNHRG